jgi:hypothetical protein
MPPQEEEGMPPMDEMMMGGGGPDLSAYAYNNINNQPQDNLVVFQLELDNILDRIEHLLKGDVLQADEEGNLVYTRPKNGDLVILNDYGCQLIINLISFYLNRNTILSNYKEDRIYEILFDLGNEIADLIYINYEKMGLDTIEKKSRYPVLVMNILHMIESSYNRALGGSELDSLRSARVVTQSQPLGGTMSQLQMPQQSKGGFSLNPFKRWSS